MKAPNVPDPQQTAQAQGAANQSTAITQQLLNMINQSGPGGSVKYSPTGTYQFTDPTTGKVTTLPQFTQNTTLSPEQQILYNQQNQFGQKTNEIAINQANRLGGVLSEPFNTNGVSNIQTSFWPQQYGSQSGGQPSFMQQGGQPQAQQQSLAPQPSAGGQMQTMAQPQTQQQSTAPLVTGGTDRPGGTAAGGIGSPQPPGSGGQPPGGGGSPVPPGGGAGPLPPGGGTQPPPGGGTQPPPGNDGTQPPPQGGGGAGQQPYPTIQHGLGPQGAIQNQINTQGLPQTQYQVGPQDYSEDRRRVEEALMSRMRPELERQRASLDNNLYNRGLGIGGQAYSDAMGIQGQKENDALMQSILGGGAEQSRLAGLAFNQFGLENAAQQQGFNQRTTQGQFANQAQQQGFGQSLDAGNFNNISQQQAFSQAMDAANFGNAASNQQMERAAYMRNQPINEILALMGAGQVQQPSFNSTPQVGVSGVDVAGLMNSAYQNKNQNYQNMMGGLFGLGGAGLMALSDRRAKKDIKKVGKLHDGTDIFAYRYKEKTGLGGLMQLGVMAQQAEKKHPDAVMTGDDGLLRVNYSRIAEELAA